MLNQRATILRPHACPHTKDFRSEPEDKLVSIDLEWQSDRDIQTLEQATLIGLGIGDMATFPSSWLCLACTPRRLAHAGC